MMKDLILSQDEFEKIRRRLAVNVKNPYTYRNDTVSAKNGVYFDSGTDWSSQNMRRIHFKDCCFDGTNLASVGFTGSIFWKCKFYGKCNLDTTIFDECLFVNCEFSDVDFINTSLCRAELRNTAINSCRFIKASLTEIQIENSKVTDCKLTDIIWEAALLRDSLFENCRLCNLNMEFVTLDNTVFKNSPIPFATVPFIFGGMDYISAHRDDARIMTIDDKYSEGWMKGSDYEHFINDLIQFYQYVYNYFPLSNIQFHNGEIESGVENIIYGITYWARYYNYKMIFYLIKLVDYYDIDPMNRRKIFRTVAKINTDIKQNGFAWQIHRWDTYYNQIRRTLLFSDKSPYITIHMSTDINDDDYKTLGEFMDTFENLLLGKDTYYSVEVTHQSPFDLLYSVFSKPETLMMVIQTITSVIGAIGIAVQFHDKYSKKASRTTKREYSAEQMNVIENNIVHVQNIQYNFYNFGRNEDYIQEEGFTKHNIGCVKPLSSGDNQ